MSTELLPQIYSSGIFKLKGKLSTYLSSETYYTTVAIRKIEELEASGIDVYKAFYESLQLTEEEYAEDQLANRSVVTLKSSSGELYHIPSSYLLSYPNGSGIIYSVVGIALDLGALPVNFDLSDLTGKLKQVVLSELGVVPRSRVLTLSNQEIISQKTHERVEAARIAKKATPVNQKKVIHDLTTENNALKSKVTMLERFIVDYFEDIKKQSVVMYADGFNNLDG